MIMNIISISLLNNDSSLLSHDYTYTARDMLSSLDVRTPG